MDGILPNSHVNVSYYLDDDTAFPLRSYSELLLSENSLKYESYFIQVSWDKKKTILLLKNYRVKQLNYSVKFLNIFQERISTKEYIT